MRNSRFVSLVIVAALALVLVLAQAPRHADTASVDPSWEILEGEPDSCTESGSFAIVVWLNISGTASEYGDFVVPGYGSVGDTHDSTYSGPYNNTTTFWVFVTTPYSVPAHTPVTLTVTTYNQPNYLGGVSYTSTLTWDCTTGDPIVAGCDTLMAIPSTAVGGTFVADALVYWAPGQPVTPATTITAGNSARVIGLDASGQYYKIIWECDYLWVPAGTLGPNYDAVWNGAPLPTAVVE